MDLYSEIHKAENIHTLNYIHMVIIYTKIGMRGIFIPKYSCSKV